MKRLKLLKILKEHGCVFMREGSRHTVFFNPQNNRTSTVPRHNEIDDMLAKKILGDLGIKRLKK